MYGILDDFVIVMRPGPESVCARQARRRCSATAVLSPVWGPQMAQTAANRSRFWTLRDPAGSCAGYWAFTVLQSDSYPGVPWVVARLRQGTQLRMRWSNMVKLCEAGRLVHAAAASVHMQIITTSAP